MLRVSDARMSGTAFGTIVLHAAPEAAIGGRLAAARSGDRARLSGEKRFIDLLVEEEEIRRTLCRPSPAAPALRLLRLQGALFA